MLKPLSITQTRTQPAFMHPAIFVSASVLLGMLFALQEWMSVRLWNYHISIWVLLKAWAVQYFLWGVICWLMWRWFGPRIQQANAVWIVTRVLPLSIVTSVVEEMVWVACFPHLPINHPHMTYWQRLAFQLDGELIDSMVIFWCAFCLFRGVGYYQRFRQEKDAAAQLSVQLAQAQMAALRMQLNPHFLFNTMNSISSLMRTDIAAADTMLEQLGNLLRITLERGEVQFIRLNDEMEFVEMYLAMQEQRFMGRVRQQLSVNPELHDALVPAMILQPIIENAYAHGFSKLDKNGLLVIQVSRKDRYLTLSVFNNGSGLQSNLGTSSNGQGVGLANIKSRLQLHYGDEQTFSIREVARDQVEVTITLPLQFPARPTDKLTGFGTS
ncbi:sensor histidine kinase [Tunturiibacter lichenicola]|uniref:sensor histidine kinase n=1 Tax=Tunturiibacter lichenicola TaxID=2051959 RepID=UPI0021B4202F|nr:histidine kinase [Edaphobacter lichenicola]